MTDEQQSLADSLAELHDWELRHMPLLRTVTGRNLYYMILQLALRYQTVDEGQQNPMEVLNSNHFTARAMRTRMKSMCQEGLLKMVPTAKDGRIKHIIPTEKFFELSSAHAMQLRKLLERRFLVVNKSS